MTDNIRGITIEINGETSPLKKALTEINKTGKELSNELYQVNKQLKFDPNNTVLLAQKQKLLKDSIVDTKNKLEVLKTTESNVRDEFAKGKISEDQYRALQREVIKTEGVLKNLEKQAKEANGALSSDQAVNNLKNIAKTAAIAGAAVGAAFVAIGNEAMKSADEIQRQSDVTGISTDRLQELQYVGNNLGVDLNTITGAQAKLTKQMAAAADGTIDSAEALLEQERAAMDVEKAQAAIAKAIEKYGKGSIEARDATLKYNESLAKQKEVMAGSSNVFTKLGISVTDGNGQLRDSKVVMSEAIDALGKMTNETERDALAMELFGKSAMELNPLIKAGGDEIANLSKEAHDNGAVMSEEAVAGLDSFGDALDGAKQSATAMVGEALLAMMPLLMGLIDAFIQLPQFIEENQLMIDIITAVILVFVAALIAYNVAAAWSTIVTTTLTAATTAFGAVMAFITSPITLVVLAIGALIAIGVLLWRNMDVIGENLSAIFSGIGTFIGGVIDGISNGFKSMANGVIRALNWMITELNKLKFDVPDWVPIIGGETFGFNIATIPEFSVGTKYLPEDMLIQAHEGEAIIPKKDNPYVNSNGSFGLGGASVKEFAVAIRKELEKANIKSVISNTSFENAANDWLIKTT